MSLSETSQSFRHAFGTKAELQSGFTWFYFNFHLHQQPTVSKSRLLIQMKSKNADNAEAVEIYTFDGV